eukprot:SAG31_NODE_20728_length_566_cov_1.880086_1_plen_70_part_01
MLLGARCPLLYKPAAGTCAARCCVLSIVLKEDFTFLKKYTRYPRASSGSTAVARNRRPTADPDATGGGRP